MSKLVFLLVGCCIIIQSIEATLEATVFIRSETVDLKALKNIAGVSKVYTIKPFYFWSVDGKGSELNCKELCWNYVVVGKRLKDAAAQDKLISDVGSLDSVQKHLGYRLSVDPRFDVTKLNGWIKKADPKFFVKRPMKGAFPKPPCPGMGRKDGKRLKLITMSRRGEPRTETKLGRELLMRIFPALKVSYNFIGQVDASHNSVWNDFEIIDYINHDTWCEYWQSQWAKDVPTKFPAALKGQGLGLAVEM